MVRPPSRHPEEGLAAGWLTEHCVTGAGFMAAGFLALAPLLHRLLPLPLLLIFLHSPAYMIHQVEEHAGDRFRRFVNSRMCRGLDVLRPVDVLVINLPLVWGLNLAALYCGWAWGAGYGLVAPYAVLVNGVVHVVAAVRLRGYNPGLATAVLVFLPLGTLTLWVAGGSAAQHLFALGVAVLLHAAIVAHMGWRLVRLRRGMRQPDPSRPEHSAPAPGAVR